MNRWSQRIDQIDQLITQWRPLKSNHFSHLDIGRRQKGEQTNQLTSWHGGTIEDHSNSDCDCNWESIHPKISPITICEICWTAARALAKIWVPWPVCPAWLAASLSAGLPAWMVACLFVAYIKVIKSTPSSTPWPTAKCLPYFRQFGLTARRAI